MCPKCESSNTFEVTKDYDGDNRLLVISECKDCTCQWQDEYQYDTTTILQEDNSCISYRTI